MSQKTTFDTFQTRENVTKCHARKTALEPVLKPSETKGFAASPIGRHGDATRKPENRDETCWSLKPAFWARLPQFFLTLYSNKFYLFLPLEFLMNLKTWDLKIGQALVNFHHISKNATPAKSAKEFARCHRLTQP